MNSTLLLKDKVFFTLKENRHLSILLQNYFISVTGFVVTNSCMHKSGSLELEWSMTILDTCLKNSLSFLFSTGSLLHK